MRQPRKRRTVAWLISGREGYGVRQAILTLGSGLLQHEYRVEILALENGPFAEECRDLGFPVTSLDCGVIPSFSGSLQRRLKSLHGLLKYERAAKSKVGRALRQVRAEVLHLHWATHIGLGGMAAQSVGVPCLWQMHGVVSERYPFNANKWFYQQRCLRYGIHPVANSMTTASSLEGRGVSPTVLYLGVDSLRFDPRGVRPVPREHYSIPRDALVFGVFGRIVPSKGQETALRALLSVMDETHYPLHLLLVGDAEDASYLSHLRLIAREANFSERLHILGKKPDPERYYGLSDIAVSVCSSVEAFGLSVVEAMMMERPVIVDDLGGPGEIVIDGETGWHIQGVEQSALIEGIQRALNQHDLWHEIGSRARARAQECFSASSYVNGYIDLVNALVSD